MTLQLFDTHCHIDMDAFEDDRDEVIARALENGIEKMLVIASSPDSFNSAIEIARNNEGIYAAVGISPFEADLIDEFLPMIDELVGLPEVVAVGECGLDYYHDIHSPDVQKRCFIEQMRLAHRHSKPVIVHCRDAWGDMRFAVDSLLKGECPQLKGIIHCFTGLANDAEFFAGRGFLISFAGNLTYKKASDIREAIKALEAGQFVFETDSPYLAPQKVLGKRNEPAFVHHTVEFAAQLLDADIETFARGAFRTACDYFSIPIEEEQ